MQRHLNIRRVLLSGENRPTVLLRDLPQRRIHTTPQRIASPNAEPRVPSATIYGPKSGSVRRNRLGHAVHYSTAPKELNIRPDAISEHGGQIHNEEAADLGNGEDPLAANDTQEDAAISEKRAYGGLGKSLVASPRRTLYRMFARGGVLKLNTQFEDESESEGVILCAIECKMLHNGDVVFDHGIGMSKDEAEENAAKALVSRLHRTGMLEKLIERKNGLIVRVKMEGDLVMTMRKGLRDLIRAGQFPMPKSHQSQLSAEGYSFDTEESKEKRRRGRSDHLLNQQRTRLNDGLQNQAADLPISIRKDQVLDMAISNTYSIIVAETGAGKSTQMPQFLFDHAIGKGSGAECRILCVQPRRIATISLAQRVAKERGEELGESVGYQIRFESRLAQKEGSITYCTTGILMRQLEQDPSLLDSISYILLDEVHERSIELDLVMLLLKRLISGRQTNGLHTPNVVIMSATLDVNLFSSYFQNKLSNGQLSPAPHLHIPGRSFPVTKHYLEEFLPSLSREYPLEKSSWFLEEENTQSYLKYHNLLPGKKSVQHNDQLIQADNEPLLPSNPIIREEDYIVPYGLIALTIHYILSTTNEGAILVFLPGMRHIIDVESFLMNSGDMLGVDFSDEQRFKILMLHSHLPENQLDVFGKVNPGCRRIILATNIAETSVTIPDVKFVVDTGKLHQNIYDPRSRFSGLACCWASQSSVSQRAGRAGRVGPGEYFAMFTRNVRDQLRINMSPDIQRQELQATCLAVKKTVPSIPIEDVLRQSIEPPDDAQVRQAVHNLRLLRALDDEENITTLGNILSDFPLDPRCGKLVLLGIIFRCLDPLLIIASLESGRTPFFRLGTTDEMRHELRMIRREYSENTWSDHVSLINAFNDMRKELRESGFAEARHHAHSRHIHWPSFHASLRAANQIMGTLRRKGLISPKKESEDARFQFGSPELNVNSWRIPLIKALILHAMYPNIATAPPSHASGSYTTEFETGAIVSAGTVNSRTKPRCLLVFNQKRRHPQTNQALLNDASHVTPLAACLLGGRLKGVGKTLIMDDWLKFKVGTSGDSVENVDAVSVMIEFRKALEMAIVAAFNALESTTKKDMEDPYNISNVSRDFVFDAISRHLVQVLDQDIDPAYKMRNFARPKWE